MKTASQYRNPLGREVAQSPRYNPGHLYPVPRLEGRREIGLGSDLPFQGADIWNAYEISWLNRRGRPEIAIGRFVFPCDTGHLIESKSLKLYLNSLNQERYDTQEQVRETIAQDLSEASADRIAVTLTPAAQFDQQAFGVPPGTCLDSLDVEAREYRLNPDTLFTTAEEAEETVFSNLLRTNCPVTGQPDWGTVVVRYTGPRIDPAGLLQYIVSFRQHTGFHENCVERIFTDISNRCAPEQLFVQAHFTRRGGLDINPWRANYAAVPEELRFARQ